MKENFSENTWEDSYQKRDRLMQECRDILVEIRHAADVAKKDLGFFDGFQSELESLNKQIDELHLRETELLNVDDQINKRYEQIKSDIEKNDKKFDEIIDESADNCRKLLEVRGQIVELDRLVDAVFESIIGAVGGFEGSHAILQSKINKFESIQQQIKELDTSL